MNKVVIKILQGSVDTQTMLGGLTVYPSLVFMHMWHINFESSLAVDVCGVIAKEFIQQTNLFYNSL